jgi:hypothetical protein
MAWRYVGYQCITRRTAHPLANAIQQPGSNDEPEGGCDSKQRFGQCA